MTEFIRAEPKPVPKNWREEVKIYLDERQQFYANQAARTNSWINPLSGVATRLAPTQKEFVSYFETLLSMRDISEAVERQWLRGEEMREHEYEDRDDSYRMADFASWWAHKYIECDYNEHTWVSAELSYVHPAVVHLLRGGTIEEAYAELKQELVEKGRW